MGALFPTRGFRSLLFAPMDGERGTSWDLFEENARDHGMLSRSDKPYSLATLSVYIPINAHHVCFMV